ncbi:MAG: hypothetical protein ACRDZO_05915 [Egibacteraceae bacterium]
MERLSTTDRTRVRRLPERAAVSTDALYEVLDSGRPAMSGLSMTGTPW